MDETCRRASCSVVDGWGGGGELNYYFRRNKISKTERRAIKREKEWERKRKNSKENETDVRAGARARVYIIVLLYFVRQWMFTETHKV